MSIPSLPRGSIIPNIKPKPNVYQEHLASIVESTNLHTEQINKELERISEEREKRYQDEVTREERMIELLESIDKNTSVLNDIFKILEENTEDQKAILDILNEFNSLATISEPTKAQGLYRKIMNKINTALTDVNSMTTLYSYGMVVYSTLHSMGKI